MLSGRLLSYLKKIKISRNGHSLSFVVTRCDSLSFFVPLVVTRFHSLSFVVPLIVTRCTTRCHSLSLVVTQCTTRLSFYKRSIWLIYWELFLKKFFNTFLQFRGNPSLNAIHLTFLKHITNQWFCLPKVFRIMIYMRNSWRISYDIKRSGIE